MKYLYIAGLEHSGTTLISQMLANAKGALALGEVGQFLSPTHMKGFMARWGQYPIARRCSCGKDWEDCDFWSRHLDLYGLATGNESSLEARYIELIRRLHKDFPAAVIIDSSKSEANLRTLVSGIGKSGLSAMSFHVIIVAKDPRAFADSMDRKGAKPLTLLNTWRTLNLWAGTHTQLLSTLEHSKLRFSVVTYSRLCNHPESVLAPVFEFLGQPQADITNINHRNSHVAVGNTNFLERNRMEIREDTAWKQNRKALLTYRFNPKASRTDRRLKALEKNRHTGIKLVTPNF